MVCNFCQLTLRPGHLHQGSPTPPGRGPVLVRGSCGSGPRDFSTMATRRNLGHILLHSLNFPPNFHQLDLFIPPSSFLSVSLLGWMCLFPPRILVLVREAMWAVTRLHPFSQRGGISAAALIFGLSLYWESFSFPRTSVSPELHLTARNHCSFHSHCQLWLFFSFSCRAEAFLTRFTEFTWQKWRATNDCFTKKVHPRWTSPVLLAVGRTSFRYLPLALVSTRRFLCW